MASASEYRSVVGGVLLAALVLVLPIAAAADSADSAAYAANTQGGSETIMPIETQDGHVAYCDGVSTLTKNSPCYARPEETRTVSKAQKAATVQEEAKRNRCVDAFSRRME